MEDTEEVLEILEAGDFESVVADLNDPSSLYEFYVAVEDIGQETAESLDLGLIPDLDPVMIGWLALLWEAHNVDPIPSFEEDPSVTDCADASM